MPDVVAAFMKALGIGRDNPTPSAALSPEEAEAPWLVDQGGVKPPGGRPQMVAPPQEADPNQSQVDIDALLRDIVKMKQRAAAAGGQPIPQ